MKRAKLCSKDIYELVLVNVIFYGTMKLDVKKFGNYWIIFYYRFIRNLHPEFGAQSHCKSINLKSGSRNV